MLENNTGNLKKHTTKNPLKRAMVDNFNKKLISIIKELLCGENVPKVLDMGCGEGFVSKLLFDSLHGRISITGIDQSIEALRIAESLCGDIDFAPGDIYHIDAQDNYYDLTMCCEVLEHLEKPEEALKELLRVTKNVLILSVPHEPFFCMGNLASLHNVSRLGNPVDHINHWTYRGFLKWCGHNRLNLQSTHTPFPWTLVVCKKG